MRFVTSYFAAFSRILAALSVLYFGMALVGGADILCPYFLYVAAFAGFAGPVAEAFKK